MGGATKKAIFMDEYNKKYPVRVSYDWREYSSLQVTPRLHELATQSFKQCTLSHAQAET